VDKSSAWRDIADVPRALGPFSLASAKHGVVLVLFAFRTRIAFIDMCEAAQKSAIPNA
jgi:hypothetical protein